MLTLATLTFSGRVLTSGLPRPFLLFLLALVLAGLTSLARSAVLTLLVLTSLILARLILA
ncbi:hypothetical protein [Allopontixanthobacter sediminis]|uniref:Uncharacterized protein n=1 Tax=Allopontixanthobacter sediminis TaxID=1689985 RepID=A0A845B3E2_9SPHN|nr:hypothetical protein [Allopontixanthobacter sediminis]MXP43947.1 hypothetical protein [Allopontixanthobacter sediminis]